MSADRNSSHRRTITGLLKVARLSDEAALGQLLSHHANYLRWIAKTCLDSRIRQRVSESDIVQETFAKAVEHFDDFQGDSPGEFEAWLRKILINCAGREVERHLMTAGRDARREVSMQNMQRRVGESTMALANAFAAPGNSPASQIDALEQARILIELVEQLPADQRECVTLRHVEGLRFREIAIRIGCTESAARMRYLRAVNQVRAAVARRGGLDES